MAPIPRDSAHTWGRNPSFSSPGPRHHPTSSESTVPGKGIGAKRELVINLGQPNPTPGIAGLGKAGYSGAAPEPCRHRAGEDISGPPRRKHARHCQVGGSRAEIGLKNWTPGRTGGYRAGMTTSHSLWWLLQSKCNSFTSSPGQLMSPRTRL